MGHDLKILPEYFKEVIKGIKTFEIRKNDRPYQVGDTLVLHEWENGRYTGEVAKKTITYILNDNSGFVLKGHVVMSIS